MQLTRKYRSLIRRLCRELYRNRVDFLARRMSGRAPSTVLLQL
jgi:hypothetical protein